MDDDERHILVQQLGQAMSDISEDCYCAGWLGGAEYFVPELCAYNEAKSASVDVPNYTR